MPPGARSPPPGGAGARAAARPRDEGGPARRPRSKCPPLWPPGPPFPSGALRGTRRPRRGRSGPASPGPTPRVRAVRPASRGRAGGSDPRGGTGGPKGDARRGGPPPRAGTPVAVPCWDHGAPAPSSSQRAPPLPGPGAGRGAGRRGSLGCMCSEPAVPHVSRTPVRRRHGRRVGPPGGRSAASPPREGRGRAVLGGAPSSPRLRRGVLALTPSFPLPPRLPPAPPAGGLAPPPCGGAYARLECGPPGPGARTLPGGPARCCAGGWKEGIAPLSRVAATAAGKGTRGGLGLPLLPLSLQRARPAPAAPRRGGRPASRRGLRPPRPARMEPRPLLGRPTASAASRGQASGRGVRGRRGDGGAVRGPHPPAYDPVR